jgi:hypothetical protein
VTNAQLKLLVQYGPRKDPALGDVPFAPDLVKTAEDKSLLQAGLAEISVGRPFLAPPGVPPDRVAVLRTALAETFADPRLLAEAEKMKLSFKEPSTGVELEQLIGQAYKTPSAIVNKLRRLNFQ